MTMLGQNEIEKKKKKEDVQKKREDKWWGEGWSEYRREGGRLTMRGKGKEETGFILCLFVRGAPRTTRRRENSRATSHVSDEMQRKNLQQQHTGEGKETEDGEISKTLIFTI